MTTSLANSLHQAISQAHEYGGCGSEMATALHAEVQRLYDLDARANDMALLETDGEREMRWPEQPTCHGEGNMRFSGKPYTWEQRGASRHCSYCGSVHPEDLLRLVSEGARLRGADWKYGWAHKFYIHGASDPGAHKWYNDHLRDEGYSEDALTLLMEMLTQQSGIRFFRDASGELACDAPCYGYQR